MSDKATTVASYAASGGTALFSVATAQTWGVVIGILLGIATFAVNTYYARKRARDDAELKELDRRIKEAQLAALERQG